MALHIHIWLKEKLEQVAKEMGVDIKVETQGGVGAEKCFNYAKTSKKLTVS